MNKTNPRVLKKPARSQKRAERKIDTTRAYQNEYEAAAFLNCQVSTLRRWRLTGEGPEYCKIGRLVRYPLESLIAFANKCRVSSTTA